MSYLVETDQQSAAQGRSQPSITTTIVPAKSVLNKATGFIAHYDFTLNPYRGCQYGCSYCYAAAFSPDPALRQDWGNWVIVKGNAEELLRKELNRWQKRHPGKPPSIYMSTVTDPYQPIETKQRLTRSLLKVLLDYQPTLVIQTRSPMIVRDMDLLQQFRRLRINVSIPTGSELVRRDFEPRAPSVLARIQTMRKLRYGLIANEQFDIRTSITITPLLPILPKDQPAFIQKLALVDRIVIQPFHSVSRRSLVAGTRQAAIDLKQKYAWWYEQEEAHYDQFKMKLMALAEEFTIEVKEGQAGFGYE